MQGDYLFKVPVYASEADLSDPNLAYAIERVGLDTVLHEAFGFDKNQTVGESAGDFYEVIECEHRQRLHPFAIVKGKRYSGIERTDKDWINSGMASQEAKLSAKNDKSLLSELKSLGG